MSPKTKKHLAAKPNKKIRILLTSLLVVLSVFGAGSYIFAQSANNPVANNETQSVNNFDNKVTLYCQQVFPIVLSDILAEFFTKLDAVSQNTQVVSQQIDDVLNAFNQTAEKLLTAKTTALNELDPDRNTVSAINSIEACEQRYEEAVRVSRETMEVYLAKVSKQKSSLAISQQYDYLNNKASNLLSELTKTKTFFEDFNKNLPQCTIACAKQ